MLISNAYFQALLNSVSELVSKLWYGIPFDQSQMSISNPTNRLADRPTPSRSFSQHTLKFEEIRDTSVPDTEFNVEFIVSTCTALPWCRRRPAAQPARLTVLQRRKLKTKARFESALLCCMSVSSTDRRLTPGACNRVARGKITAQRTRAISRTRQ
jgi:hypothetical protein